MTFSLQLWRDRRGRVSLLRVAALLFLVFPFGLALHAALTGGLGARPVNDLIHRAGFWTLMFLLTTLAVTPLRRIGRFGQLIDVRRMLGVGAFCYAAAHITLYIVDQQFDLAKVASEIALRLYLTIGFTALLGLATLAATSTDSMVRRLGAQRWRRLHQASYVIGVLALIHYFQQTKADVTVPTMVAGLFGWLMAYRIYVAFRRRDGELAAWELATLSVAVSVLTFLGEAVGIGIAYHVSPMRVLQTVFEFDVAIRPGWIVLAAGLGVAGINIIRTPWHRSRFAPRKETMLATERAQ